MRGDIIGEKDFHGAVYYEALSKEDRSYEFIHSIEEQFQFEDKSEEQRVEGRGLEEVKKIAFQYQIEDINLVKPGIGETTRVLLRRIPWKILIDEKFINDQSLNHILRLAEEKHVPVEAYPLKHYKCCGIIQRMADA